MKNNKALIEDILELLHREVKHEIIIKFIKMRLNIIEKKGVKEWKNVK